MGLLDKIKIKLTGESVEKETSSTQVNMEQTSLPEQELIVPETCTTEELERLILNEQLTEQEWISDFNHELERLLIKNRLDVELRDNVDFDITSHLKNNEPIAYKWLVIFLDDLGEGRFDDLFYRHIKSQFDLKKNRESYVRGDTAQHVYLKVFSWVNIRFFRDEINCKSSTPYENFYLVILEHLIKKAVQRVWDTR